MKPSLCPPSAGEFNIPCTVLVNTISPDALAHAVARPSAGTVLDRQLVAMLHSEFYLLLFNQIQEIIQNVDTCFTIVKTIQHDKHWCTKVKYCPKVLSA